MPTSPSSPLRFRTAGFPQYGSKAGLSDGAFPAPALVKPAPGIPIAALKFASILRAPRRPRLSPLSVGGPDPVVHHHADGNAALPQGPSLRFGLCCPDPSSLNRPHPPHSQAHHDFAAERLIRDAFAVRERLGDPRVVPRFRCPFLPNMSFPASPGSLSLRVPSSFATSTGLRRETNGSALPMSTLSGLTDSPLLRPAELLASLSEAFTSGLPMGRSASPPPDMTTVATGQFPPAGLPPAGTAASVAARSPRFLGNPDAYMPRSQTPVGSLCPVHLA